MSNFSTFLKSILFIDIETVSGFSSYESLTDRMKKNWDHKASLINPDKKSPELYFQKAGIYAEFGRVVAIGVGFIFNDQNNTMCFKTKCFYGDTEKEILTDFIHLIEDKYKNRKLILCAHNGKEFDYPYLCRRMIINSLTIPKPLNLMGRKSWEIDHLDTLDLWKFGDRKNYTSLDLLTALFDIPGSKNEMNGSRVNEVYYLEKGLEKIGDYCSEDVLATAQVYLKLNNKPLIEKENITKI
ncbi:MAG TPA: 3'-5' exonuclease [Cytophagaceae bacterium]|jgi:predicted PolB exonuclease-like 3'-5' exonuclease|nr:3'-5' exonuclease [Cytophagaceae bacterium]